MKIQEIKALAEVLVECKLTALEMEEGDFRVRLERSVTAEPALQPAGPMPTMAVAMPVANEAAETIVNGEPAEVDFNNLTEIQSPMVGVFYSAPAPEAQPFVKVGSRVKKGDVVCIIEAMKLMNEIIAEEDGEVVDVCVSNESVVEFGQTLFKLN